MTLPTIVDVDVIIQSSAVTQAGFGTTLVAGTNAPAGWGSTLIKEYASLAEMTADERREQIRRIRKERADAAAGLRPVVPAENLPPEVNAP